MLIGSAEPTTRFKDIEQSILEKDLKKNITKGKNFWNYLAKRYEISNTLACALTQPTKNVLRLNGNQKDSLIMEIHNLQGDIKDIERLVPGTKRSYIEKVIEKNTQAQEENTTNELIEYKKNVEVVDEVKKKDKDEKRKMLIPNEVIQEAKKTDMPLYDFISFLYESYKEEANLPAKVEEKVIEKKVEVIKEVPVQQKQIKLCTILDKVQNMDSYPDMRKLRAAFEIISGVINRTIPYEKVKEMGCAK